MGNNNVSGSLSVCMCVSPGMLNSLYFVQHTDYCRSSQINYIVKKVRKLNHISAEETKKKNCTSYEAG